MPRPHANADGFFFLNYKSTQYKNMEQLSYPVGSTIDIGGVKIKIVISTRGCSGCVFENAEGARFCENSKFCFSNTRKDRASVKFILGDIKD